MTADGRSRESRTRVQRSFIYKAPDTGRRSAQCPSHTSAQRYGCLHGARTARDALLYAITPDARSRRGRRDGRCARAPLPPLPPAAACCRTAAPTSQPTPAFPLSTAHPHPHHAVAIIDPLLILEPERLVAARQAAAASASTGDPASVQPFVTVSVPFRLLSLLHQGQLELADHDDPGNHW